MQREDFMLLSVFVMTMALAIGAMVLGGGWEAVRRQRTRLFVLAVLILAVGFGVRYLNSAFESGVVGLVLLALGVPMFYLQMRRLSGQGSDGTSRSAPLRGPAFWLLIGAFLIGMTLLTWASIFMFRGD